MIEPEERDRKRDTRATILWLVAIIVGVLLIYYVRKHWNDGTPLPPDPLLRTE